MTAVMKFLGVGLFGTLNDYSDAIRVDAATTWVKHLARLNHILAGSLPHLFFRLTDMILLFLGLYLGRHTCTISDSLSVLSILLLVVGGIDLIAILWFFIRNLVTRSADLSHAELLKRYKSVLILRQFILFVKLIITCVGTGYVFKSSKSFNKECEITRFYLGIVCFSSWVLFCYRLPKPSLPGKRLSSIVECITFPLTLLFNCFYFGFVGAVMFDTQDASCIYTNLEDLYYRAPLKSFAYIGLILIGCKVVLDTFTIVLNLLYFRFHNWQTVVNPILGVRYILFYIVSLLIVYYLSVGAIILFQPRSGDLCRLKAPNLYESLLIWQWIRVFWPLIVLPLLIILLCICGRHAGCLPSSLPASVTVPSLEVVLVCSIGKIFDLIYLSIFSGSDATVDTIYSSFSYFELFSNSG
jgi:hypothetical protein